MAKEPSTALVLLASEQLWPNLHSMVHWGQLGVAQPPLLTGVFIYHTDDNQRSIQPANSLKRIAESYGVKVHPSTERSMEPDAVARQVRRWQEGHPAERWLLNATGGTKLMTAGLLGFAGQPGVEIIYRELTGKWFTIHRAGAGAELHTTPLTISAAETDRIGVDTLISATWKVDTWEVDAGKPVTALGGPLQAVVRDWIASRSLRSAFEKNGIDPGKDKEGILFERLVSAAVHAMGISNARSNAVRSSHGVQAQEIDIVLNHLGQLRVIDCKLRTLEEENTGKAEPLSTQIRHAQQTCRTLGGLGASVLLVRPNRDFSETERELAASCQVQFVDRDQMSKLFSRIAEFLGVRASLPAELAEAEALLQTASSPGLYPPYAPPTPQTAPIDKARKGKCFDLMAALTEHSKQTGEEVTAFVYRGRYFFTILGHACEKLGRGGEQALENHFKPHGDVKVSKSKSGSAVYVEFSPHSGLNAHKLDELIESLRQRLR